MPQNKNLKPLPTCRNPWKVLSSKTVFENPWMQVDTYNTIHPGGKPAHYGVVRPRNLAIGIIPLDHQMHTWLVGQWRFPLGKYSWEIPEGGGAKNVDPLLSAQRELREETGLVAGQWDLILEMDISNSITDETGRVYVARNLTQMPPAPDEDEQLEVRRMPFEEVFQRTMQGEITDALAVAGILKLKHLINSGANFSTFYQ
jgi:8-oxo-dGTP pyrophosphatase MutT (NUDIX family)